MKNLRLFPVLALFVSVVLISSCKKEPEKQPTPAPANNQLILGTWKVLFFADDENENGSLDELEKSTPEDGEELFILFKSDGTGLTRSIIPQDPDAEEEPFTWKMNGNQSQLQIISEYTYTMDSVTITERDTTEAVIKTLNTQNLLLEMAEVAFDSTTFRSWIGCQKTQ